MRKYLICLLLIISLVLTGCTSKDAATFKKDYESLNGKENANGKIHREVSIPKNNPIIISSAKEIVSMIENKETFYVYFGDSLCPWCRSVVEKAIEIANTNGIKKVYYVDIWDEEGNETLRDKYTLDENNNPVQELEGTEEYYKLLEYFNDYLRDYTYTIDDETKSFGEKRIYAPNFFYVAKGNVSRMTSGKSELQTESRGELTKEILEDEEKQFDDFFINICDDAC